MGMIIDGIGTSEHLDSSGEILEIKNHDISDLVEGRGVLNWEHNNDSPEDIIGKIIFAKKILEKGDCSNAREKMYWDSVKLPFVYIKAELFDSEEHPGAIAAAALIRYYHRKKEKILAGFSIEGATLDRKENILTRTIGRRVALTLKPCNKTAISGVLEDPEIDAEVKKFININKAINTKLYEVDTCILEDINIKKNKDELIDDLNKSIISLNKTLTAGNYNVAPSDLTGGSALQTEDIKSNKKLKNKLKGAIRDWNRTRPLKEWIKAALPEVSDDYVDYFTDLAHKLILKKGRKPPIRIGREHSADPINSNLEQKKLINGLYFDTNKYYDGDISNDSNLFPKSKILKLINDAGEDVLVKYPNKKNPENKAKFASNYYTLANNFFGLGDHVPVTQFFGHKDLTTPDKHFQAMQGYKDAITGLSSDIDPHLQNAIKDNSLYKLYIMDKVLGADSDRHLGNLIISNGKIIHIDNDDAFSFKNLTPSYYLVLIGQDSMNNNVINWIKSLNPKDLIKQMRQLHLSKEATKEAVKRLKLIQYYSDKGYSYNDMDNLFSSLEKE